MSPNNLNLKNVSQMTYREQAIAFLETFWSTGPNFGKRLDEAQNVFDFFQVVMSVDNKGQKGSHLTAKEIKLVEGILGKEKSHRVRTAWKPIPALKDVPEAAGSLIHLLLFHYAVDGKVPFKNPEGEQEYKAALAEIQTLLVKVMDKAYKLKTPYEVNIDEDNEENEEEASPLSLEDLEILTDAGTVLPEMGVEGSPEHESEVVALRMEGMASAAESKAKKLEAAARLAEKEANKKAEKARKQKLATLKSEEFAAAKKELANRTKKESVRAAEETKRAEQDAVTRNQIALIGEQRAASLLKIARDAERRARAKEKLFAKYKSQAEAAHEQELKLEAATQAEIDKVNALQAQIDEEKRKLEAHITSTNITVRNTAKHELAILEKEADNLKSQMTKHKLSNEASKRKRVPIMKEKEDALKKMEQAHEPYQAALNAAQKERSQADRAADEATAQRVEAEQAMEAAVKASKQATKARIFAEREHRAAEAAHAEVVEQRVEAEKALREAMSAYETAMHARKVAGEGLKAADKARKHATLKRQKAESIKDEIRSQASLALSDETGSRTDLFTQTKGKLLNNAQNSQANLSLKEQELEPKKELSTITHEDNFITPESTEINGLYQNRKKKKKHAQVFKHCKQVRTKLNKMKREVECLEPGRLWWMQRELEEADKIFVK